MNGVYIREHARRAVRRAHAARGSTQAGLADADDVAAAPRLVRAPRPARLRAHQAPGRGRPTRSRFLFARAGRSTTPRARRCSPRKAPGGARRGRRGARGRRPWSTPSDRGGPARRCPRRLGLKPKVVFQAVRVAVTGSTVSPAAVRVARTSRPRAHARAARRRPVAGRRVGRRAARSALVGKG